MCVCVCVCSRGYERMNETHLSVFHSVLNRARETVSLPQLAIRSTRCFSLEQESLPHSRYMI